MTNLIRHEPDGWYFLDETGDLNGPYGSEDDAAIALRTYCEWLSGDDLADRQKNHLHFTVDAVFV